MWYSYMADAVVGTHVLYVGYVLLGQVAILAGILLRWGWIRNPWFRWTQLLMILIVAFEAIFGITCPLTRWEYDLRTLAGQHPSGESFIGRMLHDLMFFTAPPWVFTTCYIAFAALVLGCFLLAPPRRLRRKAKPAQPGRWFTRGLALPARTVAPQPQGNVTAGGEPERARSPLPGARSALGAHE